jgi:penicillin-binding protein 1C
MSAGMIKKVPAYLKNKKVTTSSRNSAKKSLKKKIIKEKSSVNRWVKFKKAFFSIRNLKRIIYFSVLIGIATWILWDLPLPTSLGSQQIPVSTKIYDRNGKMLYEIYADKKSSPITLNEIPSYVKQATIAIEDKEFYHHYGFSVTGIVRAAYNTLLNNKLQGGSTLTQQLVKTALLSPERTIHRKVRELALTLLVEMIYSKDKILELYLNDIPYGSTAYGIGAASELYFAKPAKDLTLAEATLLAGLTASPSHYSPFGSHPELAKNRQEIVLRRMVEDHYITQEDMDKALNEPLNFAKTQDLTAPHFVLWVKELLADKYGEAVVEKGGLRVTTTLDLDLQKEAEVAVATEVAKLNKQKVGNGAALVTRPTTGEILAMVGSKDYNATDEDGKVNIILSERQPGSSIKPINYALAIEDKKITAATPLADIPTCFIVTGQTPYCPKNYDGSFHGGTQVRFALGNSLNIPAVRVLALNGIEHFIDFARKMGLSTLQDPKRYGLSLTLGGGEVTPYDMAQAYGVLATGGIKEPLTPFLKITNWQGKTLEETNFNSEGDRVLSQGTAFIISHILSDNNARMMAFGPSSYLVVKGHNEVSVKTGTTNDRRDNWTIGYTSQALVVTWVGNNNNKAMSGAVSGVSGASPIWNTIMKAVLDKTEKGVYSSRETGHATLLKPESVIGASVCLTTGIMPDANNSCPTRYEYFLDGTIPTSITGGIQDVEYNRDNGLFITEDTPQDKREKRSQNVFYDPLGTFICLDCPVEASSYSANIKYPLPEISITKAPN